MSRTANDNSISLRRIQNIIVVLAFVVTGLLLYSTYVTSRNYRLFSDAMDKYIVLRDAADDLMEASDYLTEMAQRFTDKGERAYMDAYFQEAFITRRREQALKYMEGYPECKDALEELKSALEESNGLMEREYYAMKLVVEAKGITDYPDVLRGKQLSAEDAAKAPAEKLALARSLMLDEEYYGQKDLIRESMRRGHEALLYAKQVQKTELSGRLNFDLKAECALILAQITMFLLSMLVTMHLGVKPVLTAVENIQSDRRIATVGASEFRYLARAYNRMYEYYHASIDRLRYKASHDELTKAYNRAGYELLLSGVDLESTGYLLIDVDNFKRVNDTQGHDVGDKVLQNVAATLREQFRSNDYVCRIGGDEFAVLMTHIAPEDWEQIVGKIERINRDLSHTEGDLPAVSVSVGAAHGSGAENTEELFEHADQALYERKSMGKRGCTIYRADA